MNSDGTARWLYVAACLLVPAIWGASCAWIFGKLDQRRLARLTEQPSSTKTATDEGKR
jgi:hypothetical protein